MTDSTPDFLNPNYKFPPMPAPPIEMELARIEAAAMLVMESAPCELCGAKPKIAEWDGNLPRAMENPHEPGCPND